MRANERKLVESVNKLTQVTLRSGSLRLAWSQSTETTGSFVDTDCVEKSALAPATDEAITRGTQPDTLYFV